MIDNQEVKKIAFLSRLKIEDEKLTAFGQEFNNIMGWINEIAELNTDNIEPLTCVNDTHITLRPDEVLEGNQKDAILNNAPKQEFGYFTVPKVVE